MQEHSCNGHQDPGCLENYEARRYLNIVVQGSTDPIDARDLIARPVASLRDTI